VAFEDTIPICMPVIADAGVACSGGCPAGEDCFGGYCVIASCAAEFDLVFEVMNPLGDFCVVNGELGVCGRAAAPDGGRSASCLPVAADGG
jgi:hypothetical protein